MLKLRELEKKDLHEINRWRNNPKLILNLGAPFRFINMDIDTKWYDSYLSHRNTTIRCAVVENENDFILGLITLANIDQLNQTAELHIMIGETCNQGKGIGTFAVNEMLNHAFMNLNLRRIELSVLEDNTAAIHLYEKCRFKLEGRKRKARFKIGGLKDLLL